MKKTAIRYLEKHIKLEQNIMNLQEEQKKDKSYIFYYSLILLGLITTSWIIWSRFLRECTIRDIPEILTEFRFWILIYICCIYILVIKNLLKPSTNNIISILTKEFVTILYKPLITLDHLLKYNKYIKPYYYKIMFIFIIRVDISKDTVSYKNIKYFIFLMQVFPRIILVIFLLVNTFYFNKLELFYKVILIGVLPFLLHYIKYSLKDIFEHWIITLENHYSSVYIYEKGYMLDKTRVGNTDAIFHNETVSIREYIEIKFDNIFSYLGELVTYRYESFPHCTREIFDKANEKYKGTDKFVTLAELRALDEMYHEFMPKIISMKLFLYRVENINEERLIIWFKMAIFSLYLICWSFILIYSYYKYPIELNAAKYLLINFMRYLCYMDNPFSELYWGRSITT